jgi:iron complex outermembrane receptor protein
MSRRGLLSGNKRAKPVASAVAVALGRITPLLIASWTGSVLAADAETESEGGGVPEITVTAQLREQNRQEVPVAVSAFTADMLEQLGATAITNLTLASPGFTISRTQGSQNGASIYIRGIGNDNSAAVSEPGVGLYVDEVYLGQNIGALVDFIDVGSLEILRGPQGTLYGRNNIGGAVKLSSARPVIGDFSARGDLTFGSFGEVDVRAAVNVPINDQMAMTVSALSMTHNGWYRHYETSNKLNREDRKGLKLSYLWNISDNLKLFATADYTRDRSGLYVATPMTSQDPATTEPRYGHLFVANPSIPDTNKFDGGGLMARLTWVTEVGNVDFISSYRTFSFKQSYDLSMVPEGTKFTRPLVDNQVTEELRFTSNWAGPWALTAGLYYFKDHSNELRSLLTWVPEPTYTYQIRNNQTSESIAAYSQVSYEITPSLTVAVGGRFTHDEKKMVHGPEALYPDVSATRTNDDFSPMGTISYKITPDVFVYFTGSEGYSAGVYQGYPSSPDRARFITDSQFAKALEAGIKTEWLDNRLILNLSAFKNRYSNLPVNIDGDGEFIQMIATELDAYGAELEMEYYPTRNFSLTGYVSRLKTAFHKDVPGVAGAPKKGDPQRYSPPWSARLTGNYTVPLSVLPGFELNYNLNWVWSDTNQTTGVPYNPFFTLPPIHMVNAGITLRDTQRDWSIELGGKNLADEEWWDQASVSSGPVRYYQPGRTWYVRFAYGL